MQRFNRQANYLVIEAVKFEEIGLFSKALMYTYHPIRDGLEISHYLLKLNNIAINKMEHISRNEGSMNSG